MNQPPVSPPSRQPFKPAPPATGRDNALDAFRGLAVGGMILVNLQGNAAAAWRQAVHAAWHGLTLADLVFPFFLVAVGLSAALTSARAATAAPIDLIKRAGLLFAIGLALGWLLRPGIAFEELRLPGVLQRIAICYLVVALMCRFSKGWWPCMALALALLAVHWLALLLPAPAETAGSLEPGGGVSGWADRLLPGRLHGSDHDPEGVLSTLSALATTALGAAAWRLRQHGSGLVAAFLAIALITLGLALRDLAGLPFNKALWTPSFAAFSAGAGLAVWLALGWIIAPRGLGPLSPPAWLRFLAWMGRVALTFYVVHMVLIAILRIPVGPARIWEAAWSGLSAVVPGQGLASMAFACVAGGLCLAATRWLERCGMLLRV